MYEGTTNRIDYLYNMPDSFTLRVKVKPLFNWHTWIHHRFVEWYIDNTHRFMLFYDKDEDKISAYWYDGTAIRLLQSSQFDDGSSHIDINQWLLIDVVFDLSGTSALYIDRSVADITWGGTPDTKTSNFQILSVGHEDGSNQADSLFAYMIIIPDYAASSDDISNDFENVEQEMIYWDFNGQAVGRERFDITRLVLSGLSYSHENENAVGNYTAARATLTLDNAQSRSKGCFSDDQYGTFAPEAEQFNGSSSQKYLQQDCRIEIESWYCNDFEPWFMGYVVGGFPRSTPNKKQSTVSLRCTDYIRQVAHRLVRDAQAYDDHMLSDQGNQGTSLLHDMLRIATQKTYYNYLTNSSFENAVIGNSWAVGNGAGITRYNTLAVNVLLGSYSCRCIYDGTANGQMRQMVVFDTPELSVGDVLTFGAYVKPAIDTTIEIYLQEYDSSGYNDGSTSAEALTSAAGWHLIEVSHTITDSDSDRLKCALQCHAAVTVYVDGAWLGYGTEYPRFYARNDNDGDGSWPQSTSSQRGSASYDYIGFDCDTVPVTHEYHVIKEKSNVWEELNALGDALLPRRYSLDKCGTSFRFRSNICLDDNIDPPIHATVTDTDPSSMAVSLERARANWVKVHGVDVHEMAGYKLLWELTPSNIPPGETNTASGEGINIVIANGNEFPSDPYWANIGD
jgi:hypothetical protein